MGEGGLMWCEVGGGSRHVGRGRRCGAIPPRSLTLTHPPIHSYVVILYCVNTNTHTHTGLDLICRAHQLVQEGLKYMFPDQSLVTVWSAPNYCYRCGNVASILIFDDNLQRDVRYFTETAENSTMMQPRVPSRYFW